MAGTLYLNAGPFQIVQRLHNLGIAHVALRIVVLVDQKKPGMIRIGGVQFGEVICVLGQQDQTFLGRIAEVNFVLLAGQSCLRRRDDLMARSL